MGRRFTAAVQFGIRVVCVVGLCLATASVAVAEELETVTVGFENAEKVSAAFGNNAKGEFVTSEELAHSGKYSAKLTYVYPAKGTYPLDEFHAPQVNMTRNMKLGKLNALSFWIRGDKSRNFVFARVVDASGEVFQYKLALLDGGSWVRYSVDFTKPIPETSIWGGNGNRKIDTPIQSVGVEIRSFAQYGDCRPNGVIYLDDLAVVGEKAAVSEPVSQRSGEKRPKGTKILTALSNDQITVDGDLRDWNLSAPAVVNKDTCRVIEGSVRDDRDASAKVYAAFDKNRLFIAADVTDDSLNGPYGGSSIWQNDGIELWLDSRFDSLSNIPQEDDYQIALTYTTKEGTPGVAVYRNDKTVYITSATRIASRKTDRGYIIEASIPLDALTGLTDKKELPLAGLDISLCDSDEGRFSHTFWSASSDGILTEYGVLSLGAVPVAQIEAAYQQKKEKEKTLSKTSAVTAAVQDNKPRPGDPVIGEVKRNAAQVKKFDKFELSIDLGAEYKNPYDPEDISLQAAFRSPSGKMTAVDGFYYEFYNIRICNGESMGKTGQACWKVRFTPTETGRYDYVLSARDGKGRTVKTATSSFDAIPSDSPGFLHVSKQDKHYLEYDTGAPFFGLGYALHLWNTPQAVMFTKMHLNQIAAFGGNYASVNLQTIGGAAFDLEGNPLGVYAQDRAYAFDYVLESAEAQNVYLIPCLVQTRLAMGQFWSGSPFNKRNGGPCEKASEFFTSEKAKQMVKQRFRYTVARWGYSPNLLVWELYNEVNYAECWELNRDAVRDWHVEMASYLKSIDPNQHLVSTSSGSGGMTENAVLESLPQLDCLLPHMYSKDIALSVHDSLGRSSRLGKPVLGGECGMPWPEAGRGGSLDPAGIAFHNDLWASAMSHAAGSILHWWVDTYIEPTQAGRHMRTFKAFADGIRWHAEGFRDIRPVLRPLRSAQSLFEDVSPALQKSWSKAAYDRYSLKGKEIWAKIDPNSVKANFVADVDPNVKLSGLPAMLFGASNATLKGDLVLDVEAPQDTEAVIAFGSVSQEGTTVEVLVNDAVAARIDAADRDGKDNPYADELKGETRVKIPRGKCTLQLRNVGKGWACLSSISLKNYAVEDLSEKVRVYGMQGEHLSIFWLQNTQHTWYRLSIGEKPETIQNTVFELTDLPQGPVTVQWWDTYEGKVFKTETLQTVGGKLSVMPPPFDRDIACKILYH